MKFTSTFYGIQHTDSSGLLHGKCLGVFLAHFYLDQTKISCAILIYYQVKHGLYILQNFHQISMSMFKIFIIFQFTCFIVRCFDPLHQGQQLLSQTRSESSLQLIESGKFTVVLDQPVDVAKITNLTNSLKFPRSFCSYVQITGLFKKLCQGKGKGVLPFVSITLTRVPCN